MFELTAGNANEYLRYYRKLGPRDWRVTELGGGVSNTVLLAECEGERLVLKQALPKLLVEEDWPADRSRVEREWLAMDDLAPHLPPGAVPEVLFTDRANCLFAMSAAPAGAVTWKEQLLDGLIEVRTAERVGEMLGAMFRITWDSPLWERDFGDLTAFEQLRLDPYHRFTADRHPDLAGRFDEEAANARHRRHCAVHGDWSPKNFLVAGGDVMAIDFEVIHYGDPSFDVAFLLNHLVLKSVHQPRWAAGYANLAGCFWAALATSLPAEADWVEAAAGRHLGCLLLARVDGKSPAEYIREEGERDRVRQLGRKLVLDPPPTVTELFREVQSWV